MSETMYDIHHINTTSLLVLFYGKEYWSGNHCYFSLGVRFVTHTPKGLCHMHILLRPQFTVGRQ